LGSYSVVNRNLNLLPEDNMNIATWLNPANLIANVLGVGAALYTLAVLAGTQLPLITSGRAAFFGLAAIGFAMCTAGMAKVTSGLGWTHPISLFGIVLGVGALALVLMVAFGIRLPFITSDRAALILLAALIVAKWVLALVTAGVRAA
jgi:hypothetical protein